MLYKYIKHSSIIMQIMSIVSINARKGECFINILLACPPKLRVLLIAHVFTLLAPGAALNHTKLT